MPYGDICSASDSLAIVLPFECQSTDSCRVGQTEEIDTYLPVLAKLLSFSEADLQVVRDSFGEKEEWTFKLW